VARYRVTTFDVCAPGFERLRSESEFILCAYPNGRSGWRTLRDEWLADLRGADRGEGFDFAAARREVCRYAAELRREWAGKRNPMRIQPAPRGDDSGESITAYLYVRDSWCDIEAPVNLDCTSAADLAAFHRKFRNAGRTRAAELFPDRPNGFIAATRALADYASRIHSAMMVRERGETALAAAYESGADSVYASLPPYARW
jgi:hypothetical protein